MVQITVFSFILRWLSFFNYYASLFCNTELPNVSPTLHAVMKVFEQWEEYLQGKLDHFGGVSDNYIPGLTIDVATGQPLSKLQALYLPENTPFM